MGTTALEAVQGLRGLADFIEQNSDLPWQPSMMRWLVPLFSGADDAAKLGAFARTSGGWVKEASGPDDKYFAITRHFGPIELHVYAARDEVCEKVVVGTETVEIPDPDAVFAAPTITVEREIVEWRCHPVLAHQPTGVTV